MDVNYYSVLEINQNATPAEIKSAYRKLALRYHPDRNRNGAEQFKAVHRAYETLIDPEKRRNYDTYGVSSPFNYSESFNFKTFFKFDDTPVPKCPPIIRNLHISLEDVYNGGFKFDTINREVACRLCYYGEQNCANCSGTGCISEDHTFKIEIRKGVMENQERCFIGEGNEDPKNLPGDVIFVFVYSRHPFYKPGNFKRLDAEIEISFKESQKGFTRYLTCLDGRTVLEIKYNFKQSGFKQIYDGSTRYIDNEGLPDFLDPNLKGKLYITFRVVKNPISNDYVHTMIPAQAQQVKYVKLKFGEDPKINLMSSMFSFFKRFLTSRMIILETAAFFSIILYYYWPSTTNTAARNNEFSEADLFICELDFSE